MIAYFSRLVIPCRRIYKQLSESLHAGASRLTHSPAAKCRRHILIEGFQPEAHILPNPYSPTPGGDAPPQGRLWSERKEQKNPWDRSSIVDASFLWVLFFASDCPRPRGPSGAARAGAVYLPILTLYDPPVYLLKVSTLK